MLAHSEMAAMDSQELMGTLILLIVEATIRRVNPSQGLLALHERPDEWQKLRENPSLSIPCTRNHPLADAATTDA